MDFKMELQIGDIVGYKPKATDSLASALIKIGGRLRYSHILIYIGDGKVIEAGIRGVGISPEWVTWRPNDYWKVMRIKGGLTKEQRERILSTAYGYEGISYDFWHYPFLGIYVWLSQLGWAKKVLKFIKKIDDDTFMNCSEFVSRVYWNALGIDLGDEESFDFTLPDDIMDSELLEEVN
jgi:cell wall-associated NlpC family hydrolase